MVAIERCHYKEDFLFFSDFCQHKPVKPRILLFNLVRIAGRYSLDTRTIFTESLRYVKNSKMLVY